MSIALVNDRSGLLSNRTDTNAWIFTEPIPILTDPADTTDT